MAPSAQPTPAPIAFAMPIPADWFPTLDKRQQAQSSSGSSVSSTASSDNSTSTTAPPAPPACVTTCMGTSNIGNCTALTDYVCLCSSAVYQQNVANCWASTCNATEIAYGQAYSAAGCAQFGVNITTTYVGSATAPSGATPTGNSTADPADTTTAPITYTRAGVNISAIMTSICGALLLAAIAMGVKSIRNRIKRENQTTQNRSWTGAGSAAHGGDTKANGSRFGFSRNGQSSFAGSRADPTGTFASDNNFGMTSSNFGGNSFQFQPSRFSVGGGILNYNNTGGGFTNRMAPAAAGGPGEANDHEEEWEMNSKDEIKDEGESSPTAATSRLGESEVDLSSTTHLNRLDKGDGHARAF